MRVVELEGTVHLVDVRSPLGSRYTRDMYYTFCGVQLPGRSVGINTDQDIVSCDTCKQVAANYVGTVQVPKAPDSEVFTSGSLDLELLLEPGGVMTLPKGAKLLWTKYVERSLQRQK